MAVNAPKRVIVCDASPLIFLAKIDRLDLIELSIGAHAIVLRCVVQDEVLTGDQRQNRLCKAIGLPVSEIEL